MTDEASHLTITVDKSHILSLGERLYEQSIELIRELVNNAYDADATRVEVTVSGKEIVVSDNGEGMDLRGEIHADFLPLTSDRSGFIEDTPEFETFLKSMHKIMADVQKVYNQLA
ncbi:MAG: ATP-binding protein, partial [Desulfobacterales bacterium]